MKIKTGKPPVDRKIRNIEVGKEFRVQDLIIHGFNLKVDKNQPSGCWIWTGSIGQNGYGKFSFLSKTWLPHRVSWLLFKGSIPKKQFLCHKCDNPKCVNPDHLFLGTHKENMYDMIKKGRKHINPIFKMSSEKSLNAKLTNEQAIFIRKSTLKNVELAKMFNVTPPTIGSVRNGKTFRDIL